MVDDGPQGNHGVLQGKSLSDPGGGKNNSIQWGVRASGCPPLQCGRLLSAAIDPACDCGKVVCDKPDPLKVYASRNGRRRSP